MIRDINTQIQKLLITLAGLITTTTKIIIINNARPRDIIEKWTKTKDKEKILKTARRKKDTLSSKE